MRQGLLVLVVPGIGRAVAGRLLRDPLVAVGVEQVRRSPTGIERVAQLVGDVVGRGGPGAVGDFDRAVAGGVVDERVEIPFRGLIQPCARRSGS